MTVQNLSTQYNTGPAALVTVYEWCATLPCGRGRCVMCDV